MLSLTTDHHLTVLDWVLILGLTEVLGGSVHPHTEHHSSVCQVPVLVLRLSLLCQEPDQSEININIINQSEININIINQSEISINV